MSSIDSVMPTPAAARAWPKRNADGAVSKRASSASTSASAAGVYQSPGRSQTDATLALSHDRSKFAADSAGLLVTSCVMPNETGEPPDYDASHTRVFF